MPAQHGSPTTASRSRPSQATRQIRSTRLPAAGSTPAVPMSEDVCMSSAPPLGDILNATPSDHMTACHMVQSGSGHSLAPARRSSIERQGDAMSGAASPDAPEGGPQPFIQVQDLRVRFVSREATVRAVNGVSFDLDARQGSLRDRRIRIGQIGDDAVAACGCTPRTARHRRNDACRRTRHQRSQRSRHGEATRLADLDGVPGTDDRARSAVYGWRPDCRDSETARKRQPRSRLGARARAS